MKKHKKENQKKIDYLQEKYKKKNPKKIDYLREKIRRLEYLLDNKFYPLELDEIKKEKIYFQQITYKQQDTIMNLEKDISFLNQTIKNKQQMINESEKRIKALESYNCKQNITIDELHYNYAELHQRLKQMIIK